MEAGIPEQYDRVIALLILMRTTLQNQVRNTVVRYNGEDLRAHLYLASESVSVNTAMALAT